VVIPGAEPLAGVAHETRTASQCISDQPCKGVDEARRGVLGGNPEVSRDADTVRQIPILDVEFDQGFRVLRYEGNRHSKYSHLVGRRPLDLYLRAWPDPLLRGRP